MLTLNKLAISIWLLGCLTSFLVSVPTSHALRIQNVNSLREKREVSESTTQSVQANPGIKSDTTQGSNQTASTNCSYNGKTYKTDEQFYVDCGQICFCRNERVNCAVIECPTFFQHYESECIEPNFVPNPPNCCPKILCNKIVSPQAHRG